MLAASYRCSCGCEERGEREERKEREGGEGGKGGVEEEWLR